MDLMSISKKGSLVMGGIFRFCAHFYAHTDSGNKETSSLEVFKKKLFLISS
jgi:hypothetical protein